MSKHISRKSRWTRLGPNEHRSAQGRVFFRAGEWRAELIYRVTDAETLVPAAPQTWEAGKFKRPRNAMIALEDKATELERRHGKHVTFLSAESIY